MKKLTKLDSASAIAIRDCMGAKKNEKILVITDELKREIGISLHENSIRLGYESLLVEMKSGKINGEEPSAEIAECRHCDLDTLSHSSSSVGSLRRPGTSEGVLPGN